MLFRQLEYFVALARERHFAHAANACHVSQPALSEAIRKLEHELKVPLVRRGQKFEGLTPEGERLVHWARRILADCDALKLEVDGTADRPRRRAAVGGGPGRRDDRCAADGSVLCRAPVGAGAAGDQPAVGRDRRTDPPVRVGCGDSVSGPAGHRRSAGHPAVPGAAGAHRRQRAAHRQIGHHQLVGCPGIAAVSAGRGDARPPAHRRRPGRPRSRWSGRNSKQTLSRRCSLTSGPAGGRASFRRPGSVPWAYRPGRPCCGCTILRSPPRWRSSPTRPNPARW